MEPGELFELLETSIILIDDRVLKARLLREGDTVIVVKGSVFPRDASWYDRALVLSRFGLGTVAHERMRKVEVPLSEMV